MDDIFVPDTVLLGLTFALLVIAFAGIFSDEITNLVIKIAKIPGVKIIFPLMVVSSAVEYYGFMINFFIVKIQQLYRAIISLLMAFLPDMLISFKISQFVIMLFFVGFSFFVYPKLVFKNKRMQEYTVNLWAFTAIWIFVILTLITI